MAKRFLVVEDSPVISGVIAKFLQSCGHAVDVCKDGQEGFRQASTGDYDLVLMDLMMPNWNGFDAIGSLEMTKPATRILVVSAKLDGSTVKRISSHANVVGYLKKPFTREDLVGKIEKVLA